MSEVGSQRRASALLPGAHCARHAQRGATGVCTRCGDYLCGACGRRVDTSLYCAPCAQRIREQHSRRAARALVFGLLAVHGVLPLAPFAFTFGALELSAIEHGEAPRGGRVLARAGLWLSVCAMVMPVGAALVWVFA